MENISEDIDFDKMFKIMIFAMRINRCHPDIPRDRKWMFQFIAMHGSFSMVSCLLIYCIIFYDIKNGDFVKACANGTLTIVFFVVTYKYCVMLRYQKVLQGLMNEMKIDYEAAKSFSYIEKRIVQNYAKRGKKVVYKWVVIATVCGGLFVVKNVVLMSYYLVEGDFQLIPLYDLTYPSPIEENKNETSVYFLLYIMFLVSNCYATIMFIAVAAFGPILMLHGCGQLELVQTRIMNLFNNNDSEERRLKNLRFIVTHLQKIYRFLDFTKESFKFLYELTSKTTTFILPISFYQVIESFHNGDLKIEFITIIIGAISFCSIPCYYSDQLMDMGENVRLALYMCGWESHIGNNKRLRSTLLLIHMRAARPVAIRTMFRTLTLDGLTDVYHQSYAIFNLMNAVLR